MAARAFITGLSGLTVSANERAFLREAQPWGLIIFKRNVSTPQQVTELTSAFRDAVGWEAPVLVDQEGGRVQRLGPPHWPAYPAGAVYGALFDREVVVWSCGCSARRSLDRGRPQSAWDRRRLPSAGGCSDRGRRPGHRRPRLRKRAGQGRGHRRRHRAGSAGRRRTARRQAFARPRPGDRRQPPQAAGGRYRPGDPGSHRFCRLPAAWPPCRSA